MNGEKKIGVHPIPSGNQHMETPGWGLSHLIEALFEEYLDNLPPQDPSGFPQSELVDRPRQIGVHAVDEEGNPYEGPPERPEVVGAGVGAVAGIPEYMLEEMYKNR